MFQFQPFAILAKEVKKKKDQVKLTMTFEEIIKSSHDDSYESLEPMAEKMYNEIFDLYKIGLEHFIIKLLDPFLELGFSQEYRNRNIDIDKIQEFKDYRNAVVHRKKDAKEIKEDYNIFTLKELLLKYINLLEELVIKKYYKKTKKFETLF